MTWEERAAYTVCARTAEALSLCATCYVLHKKLKLNVWVASSNSKPTSRASGECGMAPQAPKMRFIYWHIIWGGCQLILIIGNRINKVVVIKSGKTCFFKLLLLDRLLVVVSCPYKYN